jgi:secreted trypsin-like serine protease
VASSLIPIAKRAFVAACAGALVACAASPVEELGVAEEAIVKGMDSDASQDSVVLIMIYEPGVRTAFCSGTLITSRLVLTARHCVSVTDEGASCDVSGAATSGGRVFSDRPVSQFFVFTGTKAPDLTAPTFVADAKAAKIITDGTPNFCNHDIAIIALDHDLTNIKTAQVRLDSRVAKGDTVNTVGWGYTDSGQLATVRQQRPGVAVASVGPQAETTGNVSPNEFEVGESICQGDSGGPAFDATGAVVGVASRGGNPMVSGGNPAAACEGAAALNLFTSPAPFKDFIVKAAKGQGQNVWIEGQPDPSTLAPTGAACTQDAQCQSSHCYQGKTCVADCSVLACASGFSCTANHECVKPGVTSPSPPKGGGCSASPSQADGGMWGGLLIFGLLFGRAFRGEGSRSGSRDRRCGGGRGRRSSFRRSSGDRRRS